jgi:hypothetical protein
MFIEKAWTVKIFKLVSDWTKDKEGTIWFLGLKSFELTKESYASKTLKPTALEKELLFRSMGQVVPKTACA